MMNTYEVRSIMWVGDAGPAQPEFPFVFEVSDAVAGWRLQFGFFADGLAFRYIFDGVSYGWLQAVR